MTFRRRSLALASLLSLALVAATTNGCKKKDATAPEVKKEVLAPETPVPAPEGVVAEAVIKSADAILDSFRKVTPLVPDKIGPVLADMLKVPREAGNEIDGSKPCFLVVTKSGDATSFVFGVQLKDAAKATDAIAKGSFTRTDDQASGLAIFEGNAVPKKQVVAVRRTWLLASSSVEAMKSLAPYVTRTMPTRTMAADDVVVTIPQGAMRTTVRDALKKVLDESAERRKEMLAKAKAGGGSPLGGLDALADYSARQNSRFVEWLDGAGDAKITLSTLDGALTMRGEMGVPDAASKLGTQVATWSVGDANASLDLPASSVASFAGHSSEASRAEASHDLVEMLGSSLPDDIHEADKTKIEGFLTAWDKARGDSTSGALIYEGPTKIGLGVRLGAKDAPALSKMMKDAFVAVLAVKGVITGLAKKGVEKPTFSTDKVAGIDANVLTIKFPKKPGEVAKPGAPEGADVIWGASSDDVLLTAGVGARDMMQMLVDAKATPAKTLGASTSLAAQVKGLGNTTTGAALILPSRIMPLVSGATLTTPPPPNDPILFAIGKGPSSVYLSIALSKPAVDTLVHLAMGGMMGGGGGGKKASPFGP